MHHYSRVEFDRVLEFVRGIYEPRSAEELSEHLLSALRTLVPLMVAAVAWYDTEAPARGHTGRTDPSDLVPPEIEARLAEHSARSPIALHFQRTGVEQFTRWSDLQPVSRFVRTAFYDEVYRPFQVRDWCTLVLHSRPNRLEYIGVGLDKRIPDAYRDMLISVSPHVRQAFHLAHTMSGLIEMAGATTGPYHAERGLIAVAPNAKITMETARATRALAKFFPKRTSGGLPAEIAQWISRSEKTLRKATDVPEVCPRLVVEKDGDRLTIGLFSKLEQNFLLLEEHRSAIDPAALSSLPLTRRESEILAYIAVGKTDREIAIILDISPRTVSKHVQHILERLGVETRTAAAASALETANRI
jgi:DNA-binding CsgD family transcriptional regulator